MMQGYRLNTDRLTYINSVTYTKALAIMLVVLGHAFYNTPIEAWVNYVHVPAFFFLSGYCFKDAYLISPKSYLKKKIIGLYLPYVKWGIVFLLLHNVFFQVGIYNEHYGYMGKTSVLYTAHEFVSHAKNTILFCGTERLLGQYWFLTTMFVSGCIFYGITVLSKSNKIANNLGGGILLLVTLTLLGANKSFYILSYREFMAAFMVWAGHQYRVRNLQLHRNWLFIIITAAVITFASIYTKVSFVSISAINLLPFIITSSCASISLFGIGNWIDSFKYNCIHKYLELIGRNTLTVLTWHMTFFIIVSKIIIMIYGLCPLQIAEFPVINEYANTYWALVYFFVAMLLSTCLSICNKFINNNILKL